MAKVNVSIPDELLQRLDEYADNNFQSRSGAITMMVNQFLVSQQIQSQMSEMVEALKKIADGKDLTEDEVTAMLGFEALAKQFKQQQLPSSK